jgi:hypothetical protein
VHLIHLHKVPTARSPMAEVTAAWRQRASCWG